jgi:hypothetical protein
MRKQSWLFLFAIAIGGAITGLWTQWKSGPGFALGQSAEKYASDEPIIRVKTTHPKFDTDLELGVEQPADVAPYYRVELQSQVAGTLRFLEKDIGHKVVAGERLAEIAPLVVDPDGKSKSVVTAPFDGVIAQRSADPGTFVANPAVVPGVIPLLVLERTDIVTVSMRVPEAFVAHVNRETEAELRLDALPGKVLRFKLSRIAPSLDPMDRTLRVEVDLFNGTAMEYGKFLERAQLSQKSDLKGRMLPELPKGLEGEVWPQLMPGMYGKMKLRFSRNQKLPLIPSSAIVWRGGLPYLFRVESGAARLQRIVVDLDNGVLAHVFWMERVGAGLERRELKWEDEVVLTNQGELEDGAKVKGSPME